MLRPAHYERFVIPYASRLGRELGPARLHSCGQSDHLLAAIAKIDKLGSLDTGANLLRIPLEHRQVHPVPPGLALR